MVVVRRGRKKKMIGDKEVIGIRDFGFGIGDWLA